MKIVKVVGFIVLIIIVAVVAWGIFLREPTPAFDKEKVLTSSEQNALPSLEKDYDTAELQVRHLSWGKLNYYPEQITVKAGKKVQLVGDINRLQGCFRSFTIPNLKVNGQFTEGKNTIEFTPPTTGTFGFGCSMGMGNGKLIVQ